MFGVMQDKKVRDSIMQSSYLTSSCIHGIYMLNDFDLFSYKVGFHLQSNHNTLEPHFLIYRIQNIESLP